MPKKKHLNPVLDSKHKQCTDNVSNTESNESTIPEEEQNALEDRVVEMYDFINGDDKFAQQRRRWNMIKHRRDPEYPHSISISKEDATRDIQILARAIYLAERAKNYDVVLFTFDIDFIAFSGEIRKRFNVHILNGDW